MLNSKNLNKLMTEALATEVREAKEVGALGFMAKTLVQAPYPIAKWKPMCLGSY